MTELSPGQVLASRFELKRLLGRGGMGEVWLAADRELSEDVALKVLAPRLANREGMLALLRQECRQARRLVHPNIIRVFDLHQAEDRIFVSMEHVAGGELGQLRDAAPAELLPKLIPLADALAYAHAQGVVHRDLKPSNVLLDTAGQPRLADFGIAAALAGAGPRVTGGGSPLAASPQQREGLPPSPADDAFSFGVMLHELVSGFPPRVERDQPAPPRLRSRAGHEVPEALARLTAELLEPDSAPRPSDFTGIRARLAEALEACWAQAEAPRVTVLAPASADEEILPVAPATTTPAARHERRGRGPGRGLVWAALGVLLVLLAGVVFVLPGYVEGQREVEARGARGLPTAEEMRALTEAKAAADEARTAFEALRDALEGRGVREWAAAAFEDGLAVAAGAQQAYESTRFDTARDAWQSATNRLRALEGEAETLATRALARGAEALQAGHRAAAEEAYRFVLQLQPDNAEAGRGLARAEHIEDVFRLVDEGRELERAGDFRAARERYRAAAELDPEVTAAAQGVTRMDRALVEAGYTGALSRGYAAVGRGDYDAAMAAFREAARIRPGASEPAEGIARAQEGQRLAAIQRHGDRAREAEGTERWREALEAYGEVLALDPGIAFAQEGSRRAARRAALDARLQGFIDKPERLYSGDVRATAAEALADARAVTDPGPRLRSQVATLEDLLAEAQRPVRVTLESDNLTDVTLFRVGPLGSFERQVVELKPGHYTLVGTRVGYRDVRKEITVRPGEPVGPIPIRCVEPI